MHLHFTNPPGWLWNKSANRAKMGMIFGKVDVEEPKYEVILTRDGGQVPYEIRRYGKRWVTITLPSPCRSWPKALFPGMPLKLRWILRPQSLRVAEVLSWDWQDILGSGARHRMREGIRLRWQRQLPWNNQMRWVKRSFLLLLAIHNTNFTSSE